MAVSRNKILILASVAGLVITGCNTLPENPDHNNSTQNQVQSPSPITYASNAPATGSYIVSHDTQATDMAYDECRSKETNRELAGAAIGGTVGAIAGDKIVGGTKGTILGAAIGGTAGYGIGDKLVDCDPVRTYNPPAQTTSSGYTVSGASQNAGSITISQPQPYNPAQTYPSAQPRSSAAQTLQTAPTDSAYAGMSMAGTPGYEAMNAVPVEYDYSQNIVTAASNTLAHGSETQVKMFSGATLQHTVKQGDTVYSLSRKLCSGVGEVQNLNNLSDDFAIRIGDNLTLPASRC